MRKAKRFLSLAIVFCIIISTVGTVCADTTVEWNTDTSHGDPYKWKVEGTTLYLDYYINEGKTYNTVKEYSDSDYTTRPWQSQVSNIKSVVITGHPGKVGRYTFYNMTALENVQFAGTEGNIDTLSFAGCTNLGPTLVIPASVEYIKNQTFMNTKIVNLVFEDTAKNITIENLKWMGMLRNLAVMRPVTIKASNIKDFGGGYNSGNYGMTNPAKINVLVTKPEYFDAFKALGAYPAEYTKNYAKEYNLAPETFKKYSVIDENQEINCYTVVNDELCYALYTENGGELTVAFLSLAYQDGANIAPGQAVHAALAGKASEIKKMVFSSGIHSTGDYLSVKGTASDADKTTQVYPNVKEVILPATLNHIGNNAFYGMTKLEKVNFEDTIVANIGAYSFKKTAIKNIKFPSTVSSIFGEAFAGNTELNTVYLPATATTRIRDGAFGRGGVTTGFEGDNLKVILDGTFVVTGAQDLVKTNSFCADANDSTWRKTTFIYDSSKMASAPDNLLGATFVADRYYDVYGLNDGEGDKLLMYEINPGKGFTTIKIFEVDSPIEISNETSMLVRLINPDDTTNSTLSVGESFIVQALKSTSQNKLPVSLSGSTITAEAVHDNVVKLDNIPELQNGEKLIITLLDARDTQGNLIENDTIIFYNGNDDIGLISAEFYDAYGEKVEPTGTTISAGTRKLIFTSTDTTDKNLELYNSGGSKIATAVFSDGVYTIQLTDSTLIAESTYTLKRDGINYSTFTTDAGSLDIGNIVNGEFNYSNPTTDPATVYAMMPGADPLCQEILIESGASGSFSGTNNMFVVDGLDSMKILRRAITVDGVVAVDKATAKVNATPFDQNRTVTFTGELGDGKHNFAVVIFKPATTKTASDVVYVGMITTDTDGKFTLPVQFSEEADTGVYSVIMADSNGKFYENTGLAYSKKTDMEAAFVLINDAAKTQNAAADVYNVIIANAGKLEFVYDAYDNTFADDPVKKAAYQKKVAAFIAQKIQALQASGKEGFTYAGKAEALAIFREAAIAAAISEGQIADIADVSEDISVLLTEPAKIWFNKKSGISASKTESWRVAMTQCLNGAQFDSLDDFSNKLTIALVFSIINNPADAVSLKAALTDFGSVIKSNTVSFDTTVEITEKACAKIVEAAKNYSGFDFTEFINDVKGYNILGGEIPGLTNGRWTFADDTLHIYGEGEWGGSYKDQNTQHPWSEVDYTSIKKVVFHEGLISIPQYFSGGEAANASNKMVAIEEVTFPSTLKSVSFGAFVNVKKLAVIDGGDEIEEVGERAFMATKLSATEGNALLLPASLKSIERLSFASGERDITAPANYSIVAFKEGSQLESIGTHAFWQETGLKTVVLPESVTSIGALAFDCKIDGGLVVYFEGVPSSINQTIFGDRTKVTIYCFDDNFPTIGGFSATRLHKVGSPIRITDETSAHILLTKPYDGVNGVLTPGGSFNVKAVITTTDNKLPGNFSGGTEISGVTAEVVDDNVVKIAGIPQLQDGEKLVVTLVGATDKLGNVIEDNTIVLCKGDSDNGLISAEFSDAFGVEIEVKDTNIEAGTRKMVFTSTDTEDKNVELYNNGGSKIATAVFAEGVYTIQLSSALTPGATYVLKRNGSDYMSFTTDSGRIGIGDISVNGTDVRFNYYNSSADAEKVYVMMSGGTLCEEISIAAGTYGSFAGTRPSNADVFVVDGLDTFKVLKTSTDVEGVLAIDKATVNLSVTPFDDSRTAVFTGELGSGKHSFAIAIFKPAATKTASDVVYTGMITTDTDGRFTLPVQFSEAMETGVYSVVMADANGKFYDNPRFGYSKKTDAEAAFVLINDAAKTQNAAADVYSVMTANAEKLEFVYDVYDNTFAADPTKKAAYQQKVAALIAKEIQALQASGKQGFTYAEKGEALTIFREAAIIAAFSVGQIADIANVENDIPVLFVEPVKTWYNEKSGVAQVKTDSWQAGVTQRLNNVQFVDAEDFSNKLTAALILSIVKNPAGTASLKEALTAFSSIIKSDTVAFDPTTEITERACVAIADAEKYYTGFDFTELINDIKAYNTTNTYPGDGGSGSDGGGAGLGGGSGSGGTIGAIEVHPDLIQDTTAAIKRTFSDIEGYDWANDAIETLFEKGIINGKAEGIFAPEDKVLREEFTKMIVLVAEPENGSRSMKFNDVKASDWYYDYIKEAYESGIINGVSETSFGAGRPVTRQDMCVIIANALEIKGKAVKADGEITFSDKEEIADYAKNAVDILTELGVLNGYEDNTFRPEGNATRAEAAKMIYALLKLM